MGLQIAFFIGALLPSLLIAGIVGFLKGLRAFAITFATLSILSIIIVTVK